MSKDFNWVVAEEAEKEYLSIIWGQSLSDLANMCGLPLYNFTDLVNLAEMLSDKGIQYLLKKEIFLNIPIIAHFSNESKETFLIGEYTHLKDYIPPYRAINIEDGYCSLSFCVKDLKGEVKNSKYKVVRDILPLIDFDLFMDNYL